MQEAQPGPGEAKRSKKDSAITQDKLAERQAFKRQCLERFKSADMFGQSVGLTWNGEDQYKTTYGAFISWILIIILTAYGIGRLFTIFGRTDIKVIKTTLIRAPEEEEPFRPQDFGFDFAFGLKNKLDPSIAYFTVTYINQSLGENNTRIKNKTFLPYS